MYGLILAAGKGSRLEPLSDILPKPLLPIDGKPVIYYSLRSLLDLDVERVGIVIQEGDSIYFERFLQKFFSSNRNRVDIFYQAELTGIVTAILSAKDYHGHDLLVCAGDTLFLDHHFQAFIDHNIVNNDIVIAVQQRNKKQILRRSMIMIDDQFKVKKTIEKPTEEQFNQYQSYWSGVPLWFFASSCWDDFKQAPATRSGEFVVEGVINQVQQRSGLVTAIEIEGTRDITYPEDILFQNFDYVSDLVD